MRKLGVCLSGMLFVHYAASVQAADVAAETPPIYDWSGFFLGLNAGDGFSGDETINIKPNFQDKAGRIDLNGFFGGAQIGANWQSGNWVLGAEADLQLADIVDSDKKTVDSLAFSSKGQIDWFSTVRLRSGIALDNLLLYGTGGLALGGVDYKVRTINDPSGAINWNDKYTATGWTAGAGVQWGFSANSSAKIEYLYIPIWATRTSAAACPWKRVTSTRRPPSNRSAWVSISDSNQGFSARRTTLERSESSCSVKESLTLISDCRPGIKRNTLSGSDT